MMLTGVSEVILSPVICGSGLKISTGFVWFELLLCLNLDGLFGSCFGFDVDWNK